MAYIEPLARNTIPNRTYMADKKNPISKNVLKNLDKIFAACDSKGEAKYRKNRSIAKNGKATREKRKSRQVRVYELKIRWRKLSKKQRLEFNATFRESKRLYNHALSELNELYEAEPKDTVVKKSADGAEYETYVITDPDAYWAKVDAKLIECSKLGSVKVKKGDKFETVSLSVLGSTYKRAVIARIKKAFKSLSASKSQGYKVGALKFKSAFSSIDLRRYGVSHRLEPKGRVRLSKLGTVRVRGTDQLLSDEEITSAVLVRKETGTFVKVTVFFKKEAEGETKDDKPAVGIDFGVEKSMTLSTGVALDLKVERRNALILSNQKLSKKSRELLVKHGCVKTNPDGTETVSKLPYSAKNRDFRRARALVRKNYAKFRNRKEDVKNKVVSYLKNHFGTICLQDENIAGWHKSGYGEELHDSPIGGAIGKLKNLPTSKVLGKYEKTTMCDLCLREPPGGLPLDQRTLNCPVCGNKADRDWCSSNVIKYKCTGSKASPERRLCSLLRISAKEILSGDSLAIMISKKEASGL